MRRVAAVAALLLLAVGARPEEPVFSGNPKLTEHVRDPDACASALALCDAMDAERVACARGELERCRAFLYGLWAVTGPGKAGACAPADLPAPQGVGSEPVFVSCDRATYGRRPSYLRQAFPELLRLRKVERPIWLRNGALDLFYSEKFRERLGVYPDLETLHRKEQGYGELQVQVLPHSPLDCDETRATQLALESARRNHFSVERMHVSKLVGPTLWEHFAKAVPHYGTGYEEQRATVGGRTFFYVELRYPRKQGTVSPEPGGGFTVTVPTGGSGHGVWIDSLTCELIDYLSGV